ncbi:MAG: DsrE family protein [Acidobacteriota bacterium]|nr:DsrE family protein [Acidobacteriota bacterium]
MSRVIFHVDRFDDWGLALGNVRNYLREVPDAEIEVLANASAVAFFVVPQLELKELWQSLADQGVDFALCNNALNNFGITKADLDSRLRIVPAGVVEVANKQAEGFAYVKP